MIKLKLSEFVRVFGPITNKIYANTDYKISTSYVRVIEKTDSTRLLEDGKPRILETLDEEYPIAFALQDLNNMVGHIIDRKLWTLYKYEEDGIESCKIISGILVKDNMNEKSEPIGFLVTERPYKELVVVPGLTI